MPPVRQLGVRHRALAWHSASVGKADSSEGCIVTKRVSVLLFTLVLGVSRANVILAGILDSYQLTHSFDASIAAPSIAMGDVHYDENNGLLYLAGGTDSTGQPAIRVFTTGGALLQTINIGAPSAGIVTDIAAIPNSSDFYALQVSGAGT